MKAVKITPRGIPDGTPPPVEDGPRRKYWKTLIARGEAVPYESHGRPGRSCNHSTMGPDDDGSDRDIDANGWYSNVRAEYEECR